MTNALIITAAGTSTRMGGQKKEYRLMSQLGTDTITVLSQVLFTFLQTQLFKYIVITIPKDDKKTVLSLLAQDSRINQEQKSNDCSIYFISGGKTRQKSIKNALEYLEKFKPTTVLIHDGARPWVHEQIIHSIVQKTIKNKASVPIIPSVDTQKEIDSQGKIVRHLDRKYVVGVQTPQGFKFADLLKAHQQADKDGYNYTDDSEIWARYVGDVYTIKGSKDNKKITFPEDLP